MKRFEYTEKTSYGTFYAVKKVTNISMKSSGLSVIIEYYNCELNEWENRVLSLIESVFSITDWE